VPGTTQTPKPAAYRTWLSTGIPIVAGITLAAFWGQKLDGGLVVLVAIVLAAAVLVAVYHAEVIAHRVGEPFGSLVLAISVTAIEVALIVTLVSAGGAGAETLARDTVFAAVMITMNGIVGLALVIGTFKHGIVKFNAEGTGAALATVTALATLGLVLPTFTSAEGPVFTTSQLVFVAIASLVLYGIFVGIQTVSHREMFVPVKKIVVVPPAQGGGHVPSLRQTWISLGLLLISLIAVVGLAKLESPSIEAAVAAVGFPPSFVGVIIAILVLLPESIAALRAARRNEIQTSYNLALGSAMASIGLTIPVIAISTFWFEGSLILGLGPTQITLFILTVVVSTLTLVPGKATRLQGGVHLVIFATFIFLSISP
jgi:Ca2+:H+ antiporter